MTIGNASIGTSLALDYTLHIAQHPKSSDENNVCCTGRQCYCHYGKDEPKVEIVVQSNRDVMKKINWSEIPLYISYED